MSKEAYDKICDLLFSANEESDVKFAFEYLKEMFDYNIVGGKGTRGKTIINTYQHLAGSNIEDVKLKEADVLACCIEILQTSFLVHDDIMDNSLVRRDKPCWYLKAKEKGYGQISVNDGIVLSAIVHQTLKHYFQSRPYYVDLVNVFNDSIYRTSVGQCLDMITGVAQMSNFTKERYETIVRWKTAYYSFYLPVICGMIIAGVNDKSVWLSVEKILLKIGEFFQIQDDFLDCFGDPLVIGKVGRDIEDYKCSWLIVEALQCADSIQLRELEDNYGKDDPACVGTVKRIFNELNLERLYRKYEEDTYKEVKSMVASLPSHVSNIVPDEIFIDLLELLYRRNK